MMTMSVKRCHDFLLLSFFVFLSLFAAFRILSSAYDSDVFFLIATGRDIMESGFSGINQWSADAGLLLPVQQWLYAVAVYYLHAWFGTAGLVFFVDVQAALLLALSVQFLRMKGVPTRRAALWTLTSMVLLNEYIFNIRPEAVSLIIFLCMCVIIEAAARRKAYLLALPALTAFSMQVHAALWPFLFCAIAAYAVPPVWMGGLVSRLQSDWRKQAALLAAASLASFAALFANPYGADLVSYPFKAFSSGMYGVFKIQEMQAFYPMSYAGLAFFLCAFLAVLCAKRGVLSPVSANMAAGFMILSLGSFKHTIFLFIVLLFLFRDAHFELSGMANRLRGHFGRHFLMLFGVLFAAMSVRVGFMALCRLPLAEIDSAADSDLPAICDYIEDSSGLHGPVFAGYVPGSYLEYRGFKGVYIDARAEAYVDDVNGAKDVLHDYSKYCVYGIDIRLREPSYVTAEDFDAWFDSYSFHYVIVEPEDDAFLFGRMQHDVRYQAVEAVSSGKMVLYERIGGSL